MKLLSILKEIKNSVNLQPGGGRKPFNPISVLNPSHLRLIPDCSKIRKKQYDRIEKSLDQIGKGTNASRAPPNTINH